MKTKIITFLITFFMSVLLVNILSYNHIVKAETNQDITKPLVMLSNNQGIDLNFNNYQMVSTNVDYQIEGAYQALYQEYGSNELLKKDIYIINSNKVKQKEIGVTSEYVTAYSSREIVKYVEIAEGKNIVITKTTNEQVGQEEPTNNIYIEYIINENLIWTTCIEEDCYATLVDVIINDDEIIVIGQRYFKYSGLDFFIDKCDFTGKITRSKYYSGMGVDWVNKAILINNKIYLSGYTTSTKGDLFGQRQSEDSFLISIDNSTLNITNSSYYNEELNDEIIDMYYYNNYIYLVKRYSDNGNSVNHKVLKVDMKGELIKDQTLICYNAQRVLGLCIYKGTIRVICEDKVLNTENYGTYIYNYNLDLNLRNIEKYEYSNYHMYLEDSFIDDNKQTLLYTINTSTKCGYQLKTIDLLNHEVIVDYFVSDEENDNIKLLDHAAIIQYNHCNVSICDNYIIRINNLGTSKIYDQTTTPYDYEILLNGQKIEHSSKSKIEYNVNLYGEYMLFLYFEDEKFDFCYYLDIYVDPNISVEDGKIYDTNTKITFNGQGTLNNQRISSGYTAKEPGIYSLEVEGKDQKKKKITFEIKNLSSSIEEKKHNISDINNNYIYKNEVIVEDNPPLKDAIQINIEKEKSSIPSSTIIFWPLLIPTSLAIASTFIIIRGIKR